MPAVTIVAAWINADIGVGPSIESGNQTCNGACADLPMAPINKQDANDRHGVPGSSREHFNIVRRATTVRTGKHVGVVERPGKHHDARDTQKETEIANTIDDKRLEVGKYRRLTFVPKADQQVRHKTDRFPAEEQLQEVVRHDQHQHRECEQRYVS